MLLALAETCPTAMLISMTDTRQDRDRLAHTEQLSPLMMLLGSPWTLVLEPLHFIRTEQVRGKRLVGSQMQNLGYQLFRLIGPPALLTAHGSTSDNAHSATRHLLGLCHSTRRICLAQLFSTALVTWRLRLTRERGHHKRLPIAQHSSLIWFGSSHALRLRIIS